MWTGAKFLNGYGCFRFNPRESCINAHRAAWMLAFGDPGTLHVLHRCDNRACVNPAHLFLGTDAENAADRHGKQRDARGESHGMHKLTEADIGEILLLRASGCELHAIAGRFAVSKQAIWRVVHGRAWRHLPEVSQCLQASH